MKLKQGGASREEKKIKPRQNDRDVPRPTADRRVDTDTVDKTRSNSTSGRPPVRGPNHSSERSSGRADRNRVAEG
jgi:hypothetical protein